ncbi:hypothetical protein [Accumulibacter sp.]|uniref:hypothetical protein n=1 Tax=Accumulibacter sp. TaxID=2053492 RepID=UPI0025F25E15|nr:hypothetical protein [Accumulibacter sp.]MCM8595539.1 hypothetical protein [Accumulibacter sp.]MCM8627289.1 hypothetical protein [Accumulibacter sp.]MDS4049686.1 hypothetical protein [Accumulibacter sp.]
MKPTAAGTAFCLLLLAMPIAAQEVFVTRGAQGPVYSDRPQPGSSRVTLPELNVTQPVPVTRSTTPPGPRATDETRGQEAAAPAYQRFAIVFPEENGAVAANTAVFDVRVAVEPPLQIGQGHAIMVSIDGRPVGRRFTASEFTIPPEFWNDTLPPPNQRHQVDAAIVDRDGAVLTRARPVSFTLRSVYVRQPKPWASHRAGQLPVQPAPPSIPLAPLRVPPASLPAPSIASPVPPAKVKPWPPAREPANQRFDEQTRRWPPADDLRRQ